MSTENIPRKDDQYGPWITSFASVATANATLLNLTSGQTTTLTAMASSFQIKQTANTAAKLAAKGAAAEKKAIREASEALFRSTAKVVNANPNIAPALKSSLGLNVVPTPAGPVVPVIELSSAGLANGQNLLKWKRSTNAKGTSYLIEACYAESGPWMLIATTTKCTFTHLGQTPGVMVMYRIISQRANIQSGASSQTVVYGPASVDVVTLREAA